MNLVVGAGVVGEGSIKGGSSRIHHEPKRRYYFLRLVIAIAQFR